MFDPYPLVRENIKHLKPYSSARDEFSGEAKVFLDANENSFGSPLQESCNRYPDPLQWELKRKIAGIKGVPAENIFLGNGSDEAIDILFRIFCEPGKDNVLICPPTYGMYEVSAHINDVEVKKVNLTNDFQLDIEKISETVDNNTKLLFICSPNNPTGNSIHKLDIEFILNNFKGIVVVDEAYINYSRQKTCIGELIEYGNLVVLQTFSKAWGLAGLRVGMAFASEDIIELFNKVKPPYNVNSLSQQAVVKALDNIHQVNEWIKVTVAERTKLIAALGKLLFVKRIYDSDANFILVKVNDAHGIYEHLKSAGIIVRDRSKVELCEGCLRITVGTPEENILLADTLKAYTAQ